MSSYVPPHLRNQESSSQKSDRPAPGMNGSRGYNRSRDSDNRSYSSASNNRAFNQRSNSGSFQSRGGGGYNNSFNSRSSRGGRRGGFRYHPLNTMNNPPVTHRFTETAQGKKQKEESLKKGKDQPEQPKTNSRFASWDIRAAPVDGRRRYGRTDLGFYGSTVINDAEISELFGHQHVAGINFDQYDSIPVETSGSDIPPPIFEFESTSLPQGLKDNVQRSGYTKPTPVQKYSLPIGVADRDLMACAQTGSGKTGGFLFPILCKLLTSGSLVPEPEDKAVSFPSALILAPTRELAQQIQVEALKFTYGTGIRPVVVYGGADSRSQAQDMSAGVDLLIGTPGRLLDFLEKGLCSLLCVQFLVLDEADRMLDMGFEPSIRRIVEEIDLPAERNTFMFSATFPREIQQLAQDFMDNYIFLTVGRVGSAAADITQIVERVGEYAKKDKLVDLLGAQDGTGKVLVFTETKRGADNLSFYLEGLGFPCTSIHGDLNQFQREEALEMFKSGERPVLVATDVAARGLDINSVTLVVNYDLPSNVDDYVHRIGRTGRAGNKGVAVSFFNDTRNMSIAAPLLTMLKENKQEIPTWLENLGRGGRGRGGGGGRGGRYGSRDVRNMGSSGVKKSRSNQEYVTPSQGSSYKAQPQRTTARNNVKDAW